MTNLGLFYPNRSNPRLVGYADASYLSNPHKGQSSRGYYLLMEILIFSWRSVKQAIFANSSNHAEIIAIYEVNREFVCSRSVIQHILEN